MSTHFLSKLNCISFSLSSLKIALYICLPIFYKNCILYLSPHLLSKMHFRYVFISPVEIALPHLILKLPCISVSHPSLKIALYLFLKLHCISVSTSSLKLQRLSHLSSCIPIATAPGETMPPVIISSICPQAATWWWPLRYPARTPVVPHPYQ